MSRRKDVSRFIAIISIVVMYIPSSTAAGGCVWCNPMMSQNFVNCTCTGLLNSAVFKTVNVSGLDDMRSSMIAASSAIKRSNDAMKMKMMNGAMAGELAELIKSQSKYQNNEIITREIMGIIGECFVRCTGQSHVTFIQELVDTVNFILKEPDENPPNFSPFYAPPQYPMTASASSSAFSRSNFNNQPSFGGPNNLPQQQAISTASASSASSFNPSQGNNQPGFVSPPLRSVIPPSNDFAIPQRFPGTPPIISKNTGIANGASAANILNNGPNPVNQQPNSVRNIPPNNVYDYDYAPDYGINPVVQPNSNDFSRVNFPNPLYPNDQSNSAPNSAIQLTRSNAQASSYNTGNTFPLYGQNPDLYLPQGSSVQQTNTNNAGSNANRIYPLNNPISNEPNQYNQNAVTVNTASSAGNAFNRGQAYGNPQSYGNYKSSAIASSAGGAFSLQNGNNNQPGTYSAGSASSGSSASSTGAQDNYYPSNNFNLPNSQRNNLPIRSTNEKNSPNSKPMRPNTTDTKPVTKNNGDSNQQDISSDRNDDAVAKSMRFSETIFVLLSDSNIFTGIFNTFISNGDAASFAYSAVETALNDCDYSQYSREIADACVSLVKKIPEKSSCDKYGEAFSKSLMSQFYNRQLISDNPEDQARYITFSILKNLERISLTQSSLNSSGEISSSSSDVASNKKADSNESSNMDQNNSSSSEKRRSRMARRFYRTLCKRLQASAYFRYVFNRKTSKAKAKRWVKAILRNSFKSDYGNKLAREAANECARRLSAVPAHCKTLVYVKAIAECLTDIFFYYDKILLDNPASQATDIASAINKWLSQALNGKDQSTTVSPQSADYSTLQSTDYSTQQSTDYSTSQSTDCSTPQYNDNGQDYYQDTNTADNINQQTSDESSSAVASSNGQSNIDSTNANDNIDYPYYANYPNQQSNADSGTDNDYMFQYYDGYPYQKQSRSNSDNINDLNVKLIQTQDNVASSKIQNNGKRRRNRNLFRNSNAQNTVAFDDTPADNTQFPNGYPADSNSNNNNDNSYQSNQTPPMASKSKKTSSDDRIQILKKVIPTYISNGKFDYKQFSKFLRNLLKNMLQSHKDWKSEKIRGVLLLECLIACLQLLTAAQPENFDNRNTKSKNADLTNFANSILTSDSSEQDDQGQFLNDQTNYSQTQETYLPQRESKDQNTMPSQGSQNNINSFQSSQQNSYTTQDRPGVQNFMFKQMRNNGNQPQVVQNSRNSSPPRDESRKLLRSPKIVILNSQPLNFDKGFQNKQDSVYPRQGLLNSNSVLGQGQSNLNRSPTTQNKNTNMNLMPSRNQRN